MIRNSKFIIQNYFVSVNAIKTMNLNKAIIVGNVTQAPEVKTTPSGEQVANFTIATNRYWTDKSTGEKREKTEFCRIARQTYRLCRNDGRRAGE